MRQTDAYQTPRFWGVVNTQPHRECIAESNLRRQGFPVYLPRLKKTVRHGRQQSYVDRPLFPGYLFVGIDPAMTIWRPIASTVGVRAIVPAGASPALVDHRMIDAIRDRERDGYIVLPARPYQQGERICVVGGPFAGAIAKVIESSDRDRIIVLLELLQKEFRASLDVRLVCRKGDGEES